MKIGTKLMAVITAVNLVCIGGLTVASLMFTSRQISTLTNENARTITEGTANQIKIWLETPLNEIRSVGQVLSHFDAVKPEDRRYMLNTMLHSLIMENPTFQGVWAVFEPNALDGMDAEYINTPGSDATGRYISFYSNDNGQITLTPVVDYDNPGTPGDFYNTSFRSAKEAIVEPYTYGINGTKMLITSVTVPIMSNGKVIGVAGVDLELSAIQALTENIKPFGDGAVGVFSGGSTIIAHPDISRIGKKMIETERDLAGNRLEDFIQAVKSGQHFEFVSYYAAAKTNIVIVTDPFRIGNCPNTWSVAITVPENTIMVPVYQMTTIFIILGIIILAIITLIIYVISRTITAPLKSMELVFKTIGEGDFTPTVNARSKDEIGNIGRSLNLTLEKIRKLVITIKNQTAVLFEIGSELSTNMTETAAAINEITANIQSIRNRVINQSASVTETNATMEQMTDHIQKLSTHVDKQSESVSLSSSAIEEMLANIQSVTQTLVKNTVNVKNLTGASEVGRSGLTDVVTDIQEIARESEGLLEINSVMENIASQTNLLSMNAAIEAAHAGEAGKGFAVVADEIRKLAESSGEQSKTISAVLKKIKESIDKIGKSTDNVLKKFELIDDSVKIVAEQEENIRNAMEEQGSGSKQILEAVGQLNNITQQVKSGADEMSEGSKEVITEGKNLELVTQEITGGMGEMATGAEQINTAVTQVSEISAKNKESIDILVREVSRFKVE